MSKTTTIIYALVSVITLLLIVIASSIMQAEDDAYQDREYTMMVCEGVWPNYKRIEVDCGDTATRFASH